MTRVVVGYTATEAGADALALGTRIAAATGGALEIVLVLPGGEERSVITPPDAGYDRLVQGSAQQWLREAAERAADAVTARAHVRHAESFAEGLVGAASEFGADLIVVGASSGGLRGRHRLGTVATELLHYADVPVMLAPVGAAEIPPSAGVPRITVAVGTRPGSDVLLEEAVALATATGADVRLISLVAVDLPDSDTELVRLASAAHIDAVLTEVRATLPADRVVETVVGMGDDVEEAVQHVEWLPAEIAMVGSSRLAQPRRLFLGSTASKMLHVLPVPLTVVPRTRAAETRTP